MDKNIGKYLQINAYITAKFSPSDKWPTKIFLTVFGWLEPFLMTQQST